MSRYHRIGPFCLISSYSIVCIPIGSKKLFFPLNLQMSLEKLQTALNRGSRSFTEDSVMLRDAGVDGQNPALKKPPLPISHEFDLLYLQHRGKADVDRSDWLQRVIEKNPDIQELRECLNPVARACSFARLYLPTNRLISHELLLPLLPL